MYTAVLVVFSYSFDCGRGAFKYEFVQRGVEGVQWGMNK